MKHISILVVISLLFITYNFAQGFKVKASGEQTFSFEDKTGRNQASFFSTTPLEDITGLTNKVSGTATFNVSDIKSLKGKITIPVASFKTGIDLRDEHLRSANWLDAESFPEISFVVKNVSNVKQLADNKLEANVTGDFFVHGITKETTANVTFTYLDESEETKQRAPGDLLGVSAKFNITLSDFEVDNMILGQKVSDDIEITANIVGTNAK